MSMIIPETVASRILMFCGQRVMLDADLAELYVVETKALNQAVKRNVERFPMAFMVQLTAEEKAEVVTNCGLTPAVRALACAENGFEEDA